jgi:hypothetical protein
MFTHGSQAAEGSLPRLLAPELQRACAPLVLRAVGLPAGALVRISATTVDRRGRRWRAEASFRCRDTVVDVARDASVAGSYLGVDPDGLLTSMRPAPSRSRGVGCFVPSSPNRFPVSVAVHVGSTIVASATIDRVLVQPGVTSRRFAICGQTVGVARQPPTGRGRRPPVVVLAPARSPMTVYAPGLLTSRGYPTLSIASRSGRLDVTMPPFGRRGLRAADLQRGLLSGAARAGIDLQGAVLLGVGGGAEVAARVAATRPDLGAVVTYLPAGPQGSARSAGPGRLPGDARSRTAPSAGAAAWDLLLDLLRGLSISPGTTHADGGRRRSACGLETG